MLSFILQPCPCPQKKTSAVPERSFAIGTISETLHEMGDAATHFVADLFPIYMSIVHDEDEEVRSNAIYGLGVLASGGGAPAFVYPFLSSFTVVVPVELRVFETSFKILASTAPNTGRLV